MGEEIRLKATDGHEFEAYLARPEGEAKAGLVVAQEIFGVNSHIRNVADDYARQGYLVAVPALFDRVQRGVELGYDEAGIAEGRALRGEVSWEAVTADMAAAADQVREAGKVGTVGYCWGGSVAWLAACRLPLDAAVCYYGGNIYEMRKEKPSCPVMMHFGELDEAIPLDQVEAIQKAHPKIPVHLYPAGHGFNCDQRASYHAKSAELARKRSLAFFAENLA